VVLLLKDLHWADAPSIDLVRHLGQHIRTQRLLVLATAPHEEQESLVKEGTKEGVPK